MSVDSLMMLRWLFKGKGLRRMFLISGPSMKIRPRTGDVYETHSKPSFLCILVPRIIHETENSRIRVCQRAEFVSGSVAHGAAEVAD
jgi:hypothetical protein